MNNIISAILKQMCQKKKKKKNQETKRNKKDCLPKACPGYAWVQKALHMQAYLTTCQQATLRNRNGPQTLASPLRPRIGKAAHQASRGYLCSQAD